jgi:hypothetical protein
VWNRVEFVLVLLGGGPEHAQSKDGITSYGFAAFSRAGVQAIAERGRREGHLFWKTTGVLAADRLSLRGQGSERVHHRILFWPTARQGDLSRRFIMPTSPGLGLNVPNRPLATPPFP